MSKFLAAFFLFFCVSVAGFGQAREDSTVMFQKQSPLRVGVNAGMGFGSMRFPGQNIGFQNSFIEANGLYSLSPRMGLIMGLGYSRFNFNNPAPGEANAFNPFISQENMFLSGGLYYHVTDRLTVSSNIQVSAPINAFSHPSMTRNPFGNMRSIDFNAQYKVTENFSIGAGVRYMEGNFGNGMMWNPFMSSPNMLPFGGSMANPYANPFGPANYRR